jgi:hypothetical protein
MVASPRDTAPKKTSIFVTVPEATAQFPVMVIGTPTTTVAPSKGEVMEQVGGDPPLKDVPLKPWRRASPRVPVNRMAVWVARIRRLLIELDIR